MLPLWQLVFWYAMPVMRDMTFVLTPHSLAVPLERLLDLRLASTLVLERKAGSTIDERLCGQSVAEVVEKRLVCTFVSCRTVLG